MANRTQREKEDRLLDYIAAHQKEITRYLIVVLVGEVWQWFLSGFLYNLLPVLKPFQSACSFLLWGLPYFIVCKLWVWKQKNDDRFIWMMQGMKFVMCVIVIGLLRSVLIGVLGLLTSRPAVINMITISSCEILYFIAMLKIVLKPPKSRF